MRIDVLTLFPEMFAPMEQSMMKRAIEKEKISFDTIDFRDFAFHKHNRVDDYVFGGGAGLLLKVEPIDRALKDLEQEGYLFTDEAHEIHLIKIGQIIAEATYERHQTIQNLLMKLGVDQQTAAADACKMEHAVSQKSYRALKALAEKH